MAGSEGKGRTCHGPLAGTIEGALREGKGIAPLIDTWDEGVRGSWTKGRGGRREGGRETGRTASTAGETAKGEREKEREKGKTHVGGEIGLKLMWTGRYQGILQMRA